MVAHTKSVATIAWGLDQEVGRLCMIFRCVICWMAHQGAKAKHQRYCMNIFICGRKRELTAMDSPLDLWPYSCAESVPVLAQAASK